jgi:hypothetical protein
MTSPHLSQDLLYYLAFLGGQLLFVLKRAASAIRSKTNPIASRRAFLYANWDVLLIRCVIELPIYFAFRHYDSNLLLKIFTSWQVPSWLHVPDGPIPIFTLGFVADSMLDWFGASAKAPSWLKETIPGVQVYASRTTQATTDATGAAVTVEKTVEVTKIPVPEPPKP